VQNGAVSSNRVVVCRVPRRLQAALGTRPQWAFEHAASVAERCRALLGGRCEVIVPEEHSTLVSFVPEGAAAKLVAGLSEQGVYVRDIPRTGLVRVSCGWWTSEGDLERLVAGLG
jgi:selenocysteine lyase/cysteine desulfurase